MSRLSWAIKREESRQARTIHGGLLKHLAVVLGLQLARLPIPTRRLRRFLFGTVYSRSYPPGLNEAEAEKPLETYPSLNALFTRGLKPACRPIAAGPTQLLCPCDGTVQEVGPIENGKILTLKGIEYTLTSLLPGIDTRPFEAGRFAIVFLSPVDCHRVFSPHEGQLHEVIHVPGYRLLVHPPFQRAEFPVYTLNERLILRLATPLGPCLVVLVAGWGVGHITLPLAPRRTQPWPARVAHQTFSPPTAVRPGDWIATFELGSTVVLLTPAGDGIRTLVSSNDKVKYGQPVFHYPA